MKYTFILANNRYQIFSNVLHNPHFVLTSNGNELARDEGKVTLRNIKGKYEYRIKADVGELLIVGTPTFFAIASFKFEAVLYKYDGSKEVLLLEKAKTSFSVRKIYSHLLDTRVAIEWPKKTITSIIWFLIDLLALGFAVYLFLDGNYLEAVFVWLLFFFDICSLYNARDSKLKGNPSRESNL